MLKQRSAVTCTESDQITLTLGWDTDKSFIRSMQIFDTINRLHFLNNAFRVVTIFV